MIDLTYSALKYAVNICNELPEYKVCIAVRTSALRANCFDFISTHADKSGCRLINNNSLCSIRFSNGSVIDLIVIPDNMIGKRVNLIISDREISGEIVNQVLTPMECSYRGVAT